MQYSWSGRYFGVDAQIVGETVEHIARTEGACKPAYLVEAAAAEDSPLHPLFTWDDTKAATNWRIHEARHVLKSIAVTVIENGQEKSAPAFISVGHISATQDRGDGYRPIEVVTKDEAFRREALQEAMSRMRAIQRRYAEIEEFQPVWDALDKIAA